jgi:hypothetical protein
LALWFDKNRDARVDAGELRRVNEQGIEVLYFSNYHNVANSEDLQIEIGYERRLADGSLVQGSAVDWFAQTFETRLEAVHALHVQFEADRSIAALRQKINDGALRGVPQENPMAFEPRRAAAIARDVSGYWIWDYQNADGSSHPGVLALDQDEHGRLIGYTVVEMKLETNAQKLRSGVMTLPMTGSVNLDPSGAAQLALHTQDNMSGSLAESAATLSDEGNMLRGTTRQTFAIDRDGERRSASVVYDWVARRVSSY